MSLEAAAYNEARLARIAAEAGSGPSVKLSVPFFQSGTWTAPQDGVLEMRAMGAGGGGANRGTGTGTGGYSGAWGAKILRVSKNDVVSIAIGAAGVSGGAGGAAGGAGGSTTITHAGVTRTAPGGPGGRYAASGGVTVPAGPSAPVGNWDISAASVKPGMVAGSTTGGAGVDIFARGGNITTSASVANSGGGGTGGASVGLQGGGATPSGAAASGELVTNANGVSFRADNGEWVISFYGGGGGPLGGYNGANGGGGGGQGNGVGGLGGNGGGGGATTIGGNGGPGGLGGGGGSTSSGLLAGTGGAGYACLHFYPDMGV